MPGEEREARQDKVVRVVLTSRGVEGVGQEVKLGQVECGEARTPAEDSRQDRQPLTEAVELEVFQAVADGIESDLPGQDSLE